MWVYFHSYYLKDTFKRKQQQQQQKHVIDWQKYVVNYISDGGIISLIDKELSKLKTTI